MRYWRTLILVIHRTITKIVEHRNNERKNWREKKCEKEDIYLFFFPLLANPKLFQFISKMCILFFVPGNMSDAWFCRAIDVIICIYGKTFKIEWLQMNLLVQSSAQSKKKIESICLLKQLVLRKFIKTDKACRIALKNEWSRYSVCFGFGWNAGKSFKRKSVFRFQNIFFFNKHSNYN